MTFFRRRKTGQLYGDADSRSGVDRYPVSEFEYIGSETETTIDPAAPWYNEYYVDMTKYVADPVGVINPLQGLGGRDKAVKSLCDSDPVNHPPHYTSHPSGVEVITITEHMNFCLGNAVKYILRADLKGNAIEDLKKAAWYIDREIKRRTGAQRS